LNAIVTSWTVGRGYLALERTRKCRDLQESELKSIFEEAVADFQARKRRASKREHVIGLPGLLQKLRDSSQD
jgi:hypothetical protein